MLRTTEAACLRSLHGIVRAALKVLPPLRTMALAEAVARPMAFEGGADKAREAVEALFPSGSCLSRAIAVAAFLPEAEVIIGVEPDAAARLAAHAWLEVAGLAIDSNPTSAEARLPAELARLPRHRSYKPGGYQPGLPSCKIMASVVRAWRQL
jgi:hypothetical protein